MIRPGAFLIDQGYRLLSAEADLIIEDRFMQYLGEPASIVETIWNPETRVILASGFHGPHGAKSVCFIWEQDPDWINL